MTSGYSISHPSLYLEKFRIVSNSIEPQNTGNLFYGIFIEPKIDSFIYIRTGIVYSTNTISNELDDGFFDVYSVDYMINNLEFPVLLNFKREFKRFAFSFGFGGCFLYSINGTSKIIEYDNNQIIEKREEKIKFDQSGTTRMMGGSIRPYLFEYGFRRFDYGLLHSIGLQYRAFQINFTYYYGLQNTVYGFKDKFDGFGGLPNDKIKNRFLKIGVCYNITSLKKR
jgi:hypothetical protein